jgi:hypothetical protein
MSVTLPSERRGRIEVRVRDARQLFESMDPTPFPGQDLDRDAARFIVSWAREMPAGLPLVLRFHIEQPRPDDRRLIASAVSQYFLAEAEASRHQFHQLMALGRRSLLIGLAFLTGCLWLAEYLDSLGDLSGPLQVLRESLLIGGWVALWRPLEIFLYDWWPLRADRALYQRLATADVELAEPAPADDPR